MEERFDCCYEVNGEAIALFAGQCVYETYYEGVHSTVIPLFLLAH